MIFEKCVAFLNSHHIEGVKIMANNKEDKKFGGENVPESIDHMQNDDDDVITLMTAEGEEVDFVEIAGIAYRGNFYAILQPVELLDGMEEDEALVFKVSRGKDGEDKFEIELDDTVIDAVFEEYNKLLDEAEGADGNK